jgi:flagellar hook-associated protein 3 FlgL
VNVTGSEVFGVSGTGAGSLFDVLDRMATAISNGDSATIATEHTNLETANDRVRSAAANIGTKSAALVDLRSRIDDDIASLTSRLSEVEDVDIVESLVRAKAAENSYQAAVQAVATIIPVSLLDYLR